MRDLRAEFGPTAHTLGEEAADRERHAGAKARRWVGGRARGGVHRHRAVPPRWRKTPADYPPTSHFASGLIAYRVAGSTG